MEFQSDGGIDEANRVKKEKYCADNTISWSVETP